MAFPFVFRLTSLGLRLTCSPMKINLREVEAGTREFGFDSSPEEMELAFPEVEFPEEVRIAVKVTGSDRQYLLEISIETRVKQQCSRCLEPIVGPVETEFQLLLKLCPSLRESSQTTDSASEDDDLVLIPESETSFDITERVREAIILALPLKPLCREDCRGLCPRCGTNLNRGNCQCGGQKSDPRWSKLKELM